MTLDVHDCQMNARHPGQHIMAVWVLLMLVAGHMAAEATIISSHNLSDAANKAYTSCRKVRFATFNTSLNRNKAGQLLQELHSRQSTQAAAVSHILQIIQPDVLLLNEFDYEPGGEAVQAFQDNYLGVPQASGLKPLRYAHVFTAPVNTGVPSGRDFNHDGKSDGPQDCFGYGFHPGQYGMVLLSRFPIDSSTARTLQHFLWKDMPNALQPIDPKTQQPWYSQADLEVFRLSSKSHWDVPIDIPIVASGTADHVKQQQSKRVHMLLHHPTPPAFDGSEKRNMLRNHDEIRLWADYVGCSACGSGTWASSAYIYDDEGGAGGIEDGSSFVIMGDHNADPLDGDGYPGAMQQLLNCCWINASFVPFSEGGREAGNKHASDRTPPETKTSSFDLRVDYVLPSRDLHVLGGAVWWPVKTEPLAELLQASDHRPVYLDVRVCSELTLEDPEGLGVSISH